MGSIASMLSDLRNKSLLLEREKQQLERRIKKLERQTNPLGLIEPEGPDFLVGGVILVPRATFIDEANPNTAQWPRFPRAEIRPTSGNDKEGIWRFPFPLSEVHVIIAPGAFFDLKTSTGGNARWEFALITEDFDIEKVTFNNKPASQKFPVIGGDWGHVAGAFCIDGTLSSVNSDFGGGVTPKIGQTSLSATPVSVGAPFFGFIFRGLSASTEVVKEEVAFAGFDEEGSAIVIESLPLPAPQIP